jgi:hypothetical protein
MSDREEPHSAVDPRDAYYDPKVFRSHRQQCSPIRAWREPRLPAATATRGSLSPVSALVVWVSGFLFCCLAGLLNWKIFDWGVQAMRPLAQWVVNLTG